MIIRFTFSLLLSIVLMAFLLISTTLAVFQLSTRAAPALSGSDTQSQPELNIPIVIINATSSFTSLPSLAHTTFTAPSVLSYDESTPMQTLSMLFELPITTVSKPTDTTTTTLDLTTTATVTISQIPTESPSAKSWSAPQKMTDLSAFNISWFPAGQRNLKIVDGIPNRVLIADNAYSSVPPAGIGWEDSNSLLQLFFPAHSINPEKKPQGGAEFYASPLPIDHSRNVTFTYSVFFPADFDWVLGGKLPGLYGGHTGCSGGNSARDCFSTRLMWRSGGIGELYLYAPKIKQTKDLCSDAQSTCDAAYGFSIGRGSFNWNAGAWTQVRQTVALNTPGKQDGAFILEVNGKQVIHRNDIFYRDIPPNKRPSKTTAGVPAQSTTTKSGLGGIIGPILGGIGGILQKPRTEPNVVEILDSQSNNDRHQNQWIATAAMPIHQDMVGPMTTITSQVYTTVTTMMPGLSELMSSTTLETPTTGPRFDVQSDHTSDVFMEQAVQHVPGEPVGLIGIFFSTFFGGHEPQYATPRNQYLWFTNFSLSDNSGGK